MHAASTHWEIENKVHWVLAIAFREDDRRIRKDNGAENFAVLRPIALNLLRQETTSKGSLKGRRKKAGWDNNYLLKVLTGQMRWPYESDFFPLVHLDQLKYNSLACVAWSTPGRRCRNRRTRQSARTWRFWGNVFCLFTVFHMRSSAIGK